MLASGAGTPVPAVQVFKSSRIELYNHTMNWNNWIRRLEGDFTLFKINQADYPAGLLHHLSQESFDMVCDKVSPSDPYQETFENLKKVLCDYYAPKPLEIAENYRFYQRNQEEGEKLQDYVVALQKLAINCNFGTYLKTALRNKFVFGLRSSRIRCRLLEMDALTFDTAVQTATSMEMSEKDANNLNNGSSSQSAVVQALKTRKKYSNEDRTQNTRNLGSTNPKKNYKNVNTSTNLDLKCFRCGKNHLASNCKISKDTKCLFCGKTGHIQAVCFKKKHEKCETNQVGADEINQIEHLNARNKYMLSLKVNGKPPSFEVDSGSAVTIMSRIHFERSFPEASINESSTNLISFCNTSIKIYGYATVQVKYNNELHNLNVYLVNLNKTPLLGREWIRQLNLINLNSESSVNLVNTVHSIIPFKINKLLQKFSKITESSIGKIKGLEAKLTLKDNVKPCYFKPRTIPFKLKPLVEAELQKLVQEGVLIKVDSSDWATPIVPILKKDNTVRICGDFKVTLNQYLEIDDHPLPTTDELFTSMAGGVKFSKIDLRQAYLQLEVRPEDQHY